MPDLAGPEENAKAAEDNLVAIAYKTSPEAESLAGKVADYLRHNRQTVFLEPARPWPADGAEPVAARLKPWLIMSLGGDGTLLHAVRMWGWDGTPVLGVNIGRLGFMAAVELSDLWPALENILTRRLALNPRLALRAVLLRDGREAASFKALNDLVISKGPLSRIMELEAWAGDSSTPWSYRADGLIIATPTGSTAYNLSAGGPVVRPDLASIIMTPICPFTLSSRPLMLPAETEINILIKPRDSDAYITSDGQSAMRLEPGDIIRITKSPQPVNLIANVKRDYLELLKTKLGWG